MNTTGLVRVTIAAPHRRIDLALPEHSSVAEVLPGLLKHAGEPPTDDGWLLRRPDGTALELGRTLAAHRVRDGEVLHLAHRRTEWPELEYDDLVDVIASGLGRTWGPRHTRRAGLLAGGALVLLGVVPMAALASPWWSWGLAAVLLSAGVALARAFGDAGAGAVVAALALPFAGLGGVLLFGTGHGLGAPHVLSACAAVLVVAVLALIGVAEQAVWFTGAITAALLGAAGAWLASDVLNGVEAAAVVAGAVLVFSPMCAPLAIRLGRVPLPTLPRTAADLIADPPRPARAAVREAVVRADRLLTGMLAGCAVVLVACAVLLTRGDVWALVLLGVLGVGLLLRARLYPAVRQRGPLLAAGIAVLACLPTGPAVIGIGALVISAGLARTKRGARLSRYAELLEIAVVVAVVPVVCAVLGLYGYLRGLGG
ncbi:type VII secretion integral membrane protein EccD [Saccharothrix deserti]|uniref:type VII secretion integral membrane protein EccD n=1 Tax=Saccharothrix deserti TaxID=2593674 RepID=UPI00131CD57A|nr:type VII secretion integral membrane protein EccD [Saccharothrix deserti]